MRNSGKLFLFFIFLLNSVGTSAIAQVTRAKSSSQTKSLDEFITNRINVSENKAIFTLFAMLNVARYDEENSKDGMHPVRVKIHERLSEIIPLQLKERLREYYRTHPLQNINYTYAVVASLTSGAPDFSFTKEWKDIENTPPFSQLKDLPELLREFYRAVPIDAFYEEIRSEYLSFINDYLKAINKEVSKVMSYCRVKDVKELKGGGETKYAFVIPNLLESYEKAASFALDVGFYSIRRFAKAFGLQSARICSHHYKFAELQSALPKATATRPIPV